MQNRLSFFSRWDVGDFILMIGTPGRLERTGQAGFHFTWKFAVLVVLVFQGVGCDLPHYDSVTLVEVHGVVKLDGEPVENARVLFLPVEHQFGPDFALSFGVTDRQGKFQLHQNGLEAGAMEGRHRVFISKPLGQGPADNEARLNRDRLEILRRFSMGTGPHDATENAIPLHYNQSSDLFFEVVPGQGVVRADFDLSTIDPLLN